MTHHAYRERGHLVLDADYVVVGSGAGGATAAVELARGGASVVVVEAGAWRDPEHYPSTAFGGMRDLMPGCGAQVVRGRALWPVVQGRAVGGSTVINSAICVRAPGDVFREWERDHGLDGQDLERRFHDHWDDLERELHATSTPSRVHGRNNALALQGAAAHGYESAPTVRYVRDCEGAGQCLQGCRSGRKQSLNLNFVPEVLARGGQVVSCAPVERIRFERRRATGVRGRFVHPLTQARGGRFTVHARRAVVLAASAVASPVLLMRSGVRHPALGEHFMTHPGTAVFGFYDDPVDMNRGATQGWASIAFRSEKALKLETIAVPPELVASRLSGGGSELMERLTEYRHIAMWALAVRARSRGSVRPGWLMPDVRYTLGREDMERMREGVWLVAKSHFAAGARAVATGVYGLPFRIGPDDVDRILDGPLDPRCYTAILSHLFGGCAMGADPRRAVCDARGRVRGTEALVVADASQIPTTLGVNPQHTIMALARHRARQLLGEP